MPGKRHDRCLVCGDVAIGINFGVPTCMPCKAFFRRNAVRLGVSIRFFILLRTISLFVHGLGSTICMSKRWRLPCDV